MNKLRRFGAFRRLAPYTLRHPGALVFTGFLTVVSVALQLLRPWPLKVVIDQVILGQPWAFLPQALQGPEQRELLLWVCVGALVFAAVANGVTGYARTVAIARAGNKIVARLRSDLHEHLLTLSLTYHDSQKRGDLLVRLTGDAAMMKTLLIGGVFQLGQEFLTLVGILTIMLILNPPLTLVAGTTVPVVIWLVVRTGKKLKRAAKRQRQKEGEIAATAAEAIDGVAVIQAFALEDRAGGFFRKQARKSSKAGVAAARLEGAMTRSTEVAIAFGTALVLLVGTGQVLGGRLTPGELILLLSYVRSFHKPLRRMSTASAKMLKSAAGAERLLEVLHARADIEGGASRPVRSSGELIFGNVTHSYDGGNSRVLDEVDFTVRGGEHIALLGANGSGKSTLASMLPRLRDPLSGAIRLDGVDLREYPLALLRSRVACVFQHSLLFEGSILENVQMGAPEASAGKVHEAMERAGVLRFASVLPGGVETDVGELGRSLSGGQRQRVALARALARDPVVLVLDEPTTGLDPDAIESFRRDLLPALDGLTVVLVTHDLELAAAVERGIVLSNGSMVFDGSVDEAIRHATMRLESPPVPLAGSTVGAAC